MTFLSEVKTTFVYPLFICCPRDFEFFSSQYPNRKVVADVYCDYNNAYYWTRTGLLRNLENREEIWLMRNDGYKTRLR